MFDLTERFRNFTYHSYGGYSGPWIENRWIENFMVNPRSLDCEKYRTLFGDRVPLFVQWVDTFRAYKTTGNSSYKKLYGSKLIPLLLEQLRPSFTYITVSQCDLGLGNSKLQRRKNLIVLSSGGYGNIPIPLLKQEEPLVTLGKKTVLISFAGATGHGNVRKRLLGSKHWNETYGVEKLFASFPTSLPTKFVKYQGTRWRELYQSSKYCLLPRGVGRSSYSLYEALQMGTCVPVYVWDDQEWLPYRGSPIADWDKFGLSISVDKMDTLPQLFQGISDTEYADRISALRNLRSSHFTYDGVLTQIRRFLNGSDSDLRFTTLPRTEN